MIGKCVLLAVQPAAISVIKYGIFTVTLVIIYDRWGKIDIRRYFKKQHQWIVTGNHPPPVTVIFYFDAG